MFDFIDAVKQVGYTLDIGYWMIDLDSRVVYWPKGLGRPRDLSDPEERGYRASGLDKMMALIDEADQGRFRTFLADILKGEPDRAIEITHNASWGAKARLRLAGRQVGTGKDAKIIGLVEVIDRWRESERLAKSLSFIIEALFISSDSGIVIFDGQLKVRRLNRNALDLFGVTEAEEEAGDWASIIEKKLPRGTRELLVDAIENSAAVSGTLSLGGLGAPRLSWRANPWGSGSGDMSGLVLTLNAKRSLRAADIAEHEALMAMTGHAPLATAVEDVPAELPPPPTPPEGVEGGADRHRALEWVKHPVLLVSIATGEIAFANRAAREIFHLPGGKRSFVENLFDVSGFASDVDPLAITAAGGNVLRLKLGARVGRMLDYDADLLFIEYHDVQSHVHPHAQPRPIAPPPGRSDPPKPPLRSTSPVVARVPAR